MRVTFPNIAPKEIKTHATPTSPLIIVEMLSINPGYFCKISKYLTPLNSAFIISMVSASFSVDVPSAPVYSVSSVYWTGKQKAFPSGGHTAQKFVSKQNVLLSNAEHVSSIRLPKAISESYSGTMQGIFSCSNQKNFAHSPLHRRVI